MIQKPTIHLIYAESSTPPDKMDKDMEIYDVRDSLIKAFRDLSYRYQIYGFRSPISSIMMELEKISKDDIVFNLFEGLPGHPESEILIAIALDHLGLKYTGCPSQAMMTGLHKDKCKGVLSSSGVPVLPTISLEPDGFDGILFPLIIKPRAEDASIGISLKSIIRNENEWENKLFELGENKKRYFAEPFIEGREVNISIIGNEGPEIVELSEIDYSSLPKGSPKILTFGAKWEKSDIYYKKTPIICPAELPKDLRGKIIEFAILAYKIVGCRSYARCDFRIDNGGNPFLLEINPNPDLGPDTGIARQADARGWSYSELISKIINLALE